MGAYNYSTSYHCIYIFFHPCILLTCHPSSFFFQMSNFESSITILDAATMAMLQPTEAAKAEFVFFHSSNPKAEVPKAETIVAKEKVPQPQPVYCERLTLEPESV